MIEAESARQNLRAQENLWHKVIMFTTGRIAGQELRNSGDTESVPYSYKYNQVAPAELSAFERDWHHYLDGKASFEQALRGLVRDAR